MNIVDWASYIFSSSEIEDKLLDADLVSDYSYKVKKFFVVTPGRSDSIKFSDKKIKFPKVSSFTDPYNRAKAIAFFANHELEAIEMMCAAIIKFGKTIEAKEFEKVSRGIWSSIKDEQKHLKMYLKRLEEFGFKLSDFSLNDFFWKQFENLTSFDDFFSLMALTFEAANLDFCIFYEKVFKAVGDVQTALIMNEIYKDEISHVKLGVYWLNKWRDSDSLWNYYIDHLPKNISPERSKGIKFDLNSREVVGLDLDFLENLTKFDDGFQIAKRKLNYEKNKIP